MTVFDTNIIIDYLNGHNGALTEFDAVRRPIVSIVTWMEVLVGIPDDVRSSVEEFFHDRCEVIPIDEEIARHAIRFRVSKKLKLLDAMVLSTAFVRDQILVTRDSGFPENDPLIRVPYKL